MIDFTKTERAVLIHRLEVPDALADALEEQHPDKEMTMREARGLLATFKSGAAYDYEKAGQLQRDILRDCVEGSTFFADCEDAVATGELTRGKLLSEQKAARSIEKKLGVYFPGY